MGKGAADQHHERRLERVFGIVGIAEQPFAEAVDHRAMTADDLLRLRKLGYRAFLIGERFMTAREPGASLKELMAQMKARRGQLATTEDTEL